MKVYLIYTKIPIRDYEKRIRSMLPHQPIYDIIEDSYCGLYAWTTEKDLLEEFLEFRNSKKDRYKVKKVKMDEDEFEEFNINFIELKLKRYRYDYSKRGEKTIDIVSTKNEYVQATEYTIENLLNVLPSFEVDYYVFKDDIIAALDSLSYTTFFDENYNADDDRLSLANFNHSYNLTVGGRECRCFEDNQAMVLLYLFEPMF